MANHRELRAVIEFIMYDQSATDSYGKHIKLCECMSFPTITINREDGHKLVWTPNLLARSAGSAYLA